MKSIKTMMVVTMLASVATLTILVAGIGKGQELKEEYEKKFDEFSASPLNSLLSVVGLGKKGA